MTRTTLFAAGLLLLAGCRAAPDKAADTDTELEDQYVPGTPDDDTGSEDSGSEDTGVDDTGVDDTGDTDDAPDPDALSCDTPISGGALFGELYGTGDTHLGYIWVDDRCSLELHVNAPIDLSAYPAPLLRLDWGDMALVTADLDARTYDGEIVTLRWDPDAHPGVPFDDLNPLIAYIVDGEDPSLPAYRSDVLFAP